MLPSHVLTAVRDGLSISDWLTSCSKRVTPLPTNASSAFPNFTSRQSFYRSIVQVISRLVVWHRYQKEVYSTTRKRKTTRNHSFIHSFVRRYAM